MQKNTIKYISLIRNHNQNQRHIWSYKSVGPQVVTYEIVKNASILSENNTNK
jgi:hypothetical protein